MLVIGEHNDFCVAFGLGVGRTTDGNGGKLSLFPTPLFSALIKIELCSSIEPKIKNLVSAETPEIAFPCVGCQRDQNEHERCITNPVSRLSFWQKFTIFGVSNTKPGSRKTPAYITG